MTDEPVAVTAADREAAADFLESWEPGPEMTVVKLAAAFARHRTPPPTDAAPVGDTFGALTTALFDLDNTARLSDNPSAVPAARDRAKTLLDWMRRHGVTVVPLRADDDALGDAVERVRHECTQFVRNCGMNASDLAERIRALLPAPPATDEGK